ncbi:MAG: HIT family protein [Erysipelotrichaceae bacterium]|jgi:histidine triad (HIT) family protein|nr:HIT family protein [Erysipelotrichaceae bacterium]
MCVFCDIISGNIPSSKVYEDDDVLAILDLSQTTRGHTLVMPKKHYENFLEMPNDEYMNLMGKAQLITDKVVKNLKAKGCNILINTNEIAGQTIMHTHVHIIPRYGVKDTIIFKFTENKYDLDSIAKEINSQD